jgi:ribosomal silencing factor RsfS
LPTIDEVKDFLMREMFKDIQIFDLIQLNKSQLGDVGVLATGYSHRHVYKTAKTLSKEMEKLDKESKDILNNIIKLI